METIQTAHGTLCLLLPAGCTLYENARETLRNAASTGADFLYFDMEIRLPSGRVKRAVRPNWSPDTLLSCNYLDGPVAVKESLLSGFSEAALSDAKSRYAWMLKLTERATYIRRIPEVLAKWDAQPPCTDTGVIMEALHRRRVSGYVERGGTVGTFAVRYPVPVDTKLGCIVYAQAGMRDVRRTLESLVSRCCWPKLQIFIADNGAADEQLERYYAVLEHRHIAKVFRDPNERSIARLINLAADRVTGEALLLLPAGMTVRSFDAPERMLELTLQRHIGAVGASYQERQATRQGIIHNTESLEGAMMTRTEAFYAAGMLDETFEQTGFIRAFTLLNRERRLFNVTTPYALFSAQPEIAEEKLTTVNRQRLKDVESLAERGGSGEKDTYAEALGFLPSFVKT